jgi:hypothetical protein
MADIREERSKQFEYQFSGFTDDEKNVVRRFLVEADRNGNHHMAGADFHGTSTQLNNLLPLLMTLCPSMRPSSVGVVPGDAVQVFRLTYSPGDLIIPDFILDEVCSPMSDESNEEEDGGGLLQRSMSSSATPRVQHQFESDDCPSSCR